MENSQLTDYFDVKEDVNYAPWDNRIKQELVLRYWSCSLKCHLCYSQKIAYLEKPTEKSLFSLQQCINGLKNFSGKVKWTRIQGGEPFLGNSRPFFTSGISVEALKHLLQGHSNDINPRVVIQTNGIWFGQNELSATEKIIEEINQGMSGLERGRIAIEVSFKGPNKQTANEYAKSEEIGISDVLQTQLVGFYNLLKAIEKIAWSNGNNRVAIYPIAGIGPVLHEPSFIPIDSNHNRLLPIFHPLTWSEDFSKMVNTFVEILDKRKDVYKDYREKQMQKIPLESMEPKYFQKGWTSQIKKSKILRDFLVENLRINKTPSLNFFNKELEELNISEATYELLFKIQDLKKYFYEAEPSEHYPYL